MQPAVTHERRDATNMFFSFVRQWNFSVHSRHPATSKICGNNQVCAGFAVTASNNERNFICELEIDFN